MVALDYWGPGNSTMGFGRLGPLDVSSLILGGFCLGIALGAAGGVIACLVSFFWAGVRHPFRSASCYASVGGCLWLLRWNWVRFERMNQPEIFHSLLLLAIFVIVGALYGFLIGLLGTRLERGLDIIQQKHRNQK